jgi:N-acetyl-anhydromuramyl-L-alanine amidase AmpD
VQIKKLTDLLTDIKARHGENIPGTNILGHSDVAPGRKIDPGAVFPWKELAQKGFGLNCTDIPEVEGMVIGNVDSDADVMHNIQHRLSHLGYKINVDGVYNSQTADVIRAFKFHYQQDTKTGWGDWDIAADNCLDEILGKQMPEQYIEL